MNTKKLPNLCLLFCGGTITMARDASTGALEPALSAEKLLEKVPELSELANIDAVFLSNADSTNHNAELWTKLAAEISSRMDDYDGFIVTHGTDTMAYTASALSFLLQDLPKPIIVTGSQTPLSLLGNDARNNLLFSTHFASKDIGEVCILFGSKLLRGNRSLKFSSEDYDAFRSFHVPPLGKAGSKPRLLPHVIKRHAGPVTYSKEFEDQIFLLKYFPGLKARVLSRIAESGHKGIVIEAVGTGNLPVNVGFAKAIEELAKSNMPVVVTTECIVGGTNISNYGPGKAIEDAGAISGLDMTTTAAYTKLGWAMGKASELATIKRLMQKNLCGELFETK